MDPWPIFYTCPACQREFEAVAGEQAQLVHCPDCGMAVVVAAQDGNIDLPEPEEKESDREDELDGLRIRNFARQRRSATRRQSHFFVGCAGCVIAAAQSIYYAVGAFRHHDPWIWPVAYLVAAAGLLQLARYWYRRMLHYRAEARQPLLQEPTGQPDFSTLQDGSQMLDKLNQFREGK